MPTAPPVDSFSHVSSLKDPRIDRTKRHDLLEMIVSAPCAILCGADSWVAVAACGKAKEAW